MTENPEVLRDLEGLCKRLAAEPQSLEQLCQDHALLWRRLDWSKAQIRLWLRSLPAMRVEAADSDDPRYRLVASESTAPDLGEAIAQVVVALGKPVPLAQLRNRLPPGILASEPMLRAAIRNHPRLTLTGPLVRLLK